MTPQTAGEGVGVSDSELLSEVDADKASEATAKASEVKCNALSQKATFPQLYTLNPCCKILPALSIFDPQMILGLCRTPTHGWWHSIGPLSLSLKSADT